MKKMILLAGFTSLLQVAFGQTDEISAAVNWVNKNTIPIDFVKAGNGFGDIEPLNALVGNARIVALGECTHGSSEVFSMKHRMLEFLVKEKGFTIFSIEANMPEAYSLNEYIINGKGDAKKLLSGMYFWTWYTQEVLDMIEWMKTYNETAVNKIMFTGFDMQIPKIALINVRKYLEMNKPQLLNAINEYDSLYKTGGSIKNFWKKKSKRLIEITQTITDSLNGMPDSKEKRWILQNIKILAQNAGLFGKESYRDECMAANAKWILDENPNAKMVLWAHNEHIRKMKNKFGVERMGSWLANWYGNQFIAIGFATEEGTYTAVGKDNHVDSANVLTPSKKGSCEYILKQANAANFIIDLRKAKKGDAGTDGYLSKLQ
ncbi:MAG: erythromycin esterase family protein [Ferruginibacter sp.]